jgi:hypothetical protein
LKETSHRKRTKVDLEEVKNEEEELKEDKQSYLRQSKRLKEEKQDLLNTIEALKHYEGLVNNLHHAGVIDHMGNPVQEEHL